MQTTCFCAQGTAGVPVHSTEGKSGTGENSFSQEIVQLTNIWFGFNTHLWTQPYSKHWWYAIWQGRCIWPHWHAMEKPALKDRFESLTISLFSRDLVNEWPGAADGWMTVQSCHGSCIERMKCFVCANSYPLRSYIHSLETTRFAWVCSWENDYMRIPGLWLALTTVEFIPALEARNPLWKKLPAAYIERITFCWNLFHFSPFYDPSEGDYCLFALRSCR